METLLTAIVTWLSATFSLPAIHEHPRVEFVSAETMHAVRYRASRSGERARTALHSGPAIRADRLPEVEALYDDKTRTIYLPKGWTGKTPGEVSVLVHEMVHHLQNVGGLKYGCAGEREKLAYLAQDRWLARDGLNLMDEFKLDPMTLLVRTNCLF